jgi:hypothetical protein
VFRTRVHEEGGENNLQKTRILLGVSLALSVAGHTVAAERTRTASRDNDQIRSSSEARVIAPRDIQMVAPGLGRSEINGITVFNRADGVIDRDETIALYGSIEKFEMALVLASVPSMKGPDGETIAANGVVFNNREFMGDLATDDMPFRTAEEYKEHMAYATWTVHGVELMVFADGIVLPGMVTSDPLAATGNAPWLIGADGKIIAANGVVIDQR